MSQFKSISALTKSNNTFDGIQEGEEVLLFLHRHKLILILRLAGIALTLIAPIILYPIISYGIGYIGLTSFLPFAIGIYLLMIWSVVMKMVTMYLLDYWIVTNRRILSNTQHGFWNRHISELRFSRVQDISTKTRGIIQTFFNFGNVEIQSAGATNKFIFEDIPKPSQTKDKIMALVHSHRNLPDQSTI